MAHQKSLLFLRMSHLILLYLYLHLLGQMCIRDRYTSDPTDADSGTEVSGGSYARTSATFDAPSNGVTQNSADVTFPTATDSWGTVSHIGIHDASTGGNLLFHTPLDTSKTIDSGDIFKIESGNLSVTLA